MKRTAIEVVLDQPTAAEKRAWLQTVPVPLRSISFGAHGQPLAPEALAAELTVSADLLATSEHTLEVGPPLYGM